MAHGTPSLPEAIDRLAASTPEKTWVSFAASTEALSKKEPLVDVSFGVLANAVNRVAWHLHQNIPSHGDLSTTICYIGENDIRYFILACAATKARPMRSCQSLKESCGMDHFDMLTLDETLSEEKVEPYPWHRHFEDIAREPFVILHTSGSTGEPKPVEVTHGLAATIDAQQDLPDVDGRCITSRMWRHRTIFAGLPLFHSAGFNILSFSIFQGTKVVFGPSDAPPSVGLVDSMLDMDIVSAGIMAPSLLGEVANEPSIVQKLSRWDSVGFGGGPLSDSAAKTVLKYTKVLPLLGSTETFNIPELLPQSEDELAYHYYHFALGIKFDPVSDGLHELVFVRDADHLKHQGAFCTFPELDEYRMKDLYEEHPTKPGLWRYQGRMDDVVVLSNGEKWNPRSAEQIVSQHQAVQSALIVGTGHEQPLLLVEAKEDVPSDRRRSSVEDSEELRLANEALPAYAQIDASHIHILEPDSFLRSAKGEIRRRPTVAMLEAEIVNAYAAAEDRIASDVRLDFSSDQKLAESLSSLVVSEILPGESLSPAEDFFQRRVDSQRVLRLTRAIKADMRAQQRQDAGQVSPRTIYTERTVENLAAFLYNGRSSAENEDTEDRMLQDMQRMLSSYTSALEEHTPADGKKPRSDSVQILLTGSTGSLGSYLLDALLKCFPTGRIVCLNRRGGNAERQRKIQESRGLSLNVSRVEFLESTISEHDFGLSDQALAALDGTTHIIHNAWPVNFNLPLGAFEDQLKACLNLVALAQRLPHRVNTTFLSSIGAANHWAMRGNTGPVPEDKLDDLAVTEKSGYAQSKLVAEHLFEVASKRFQLPTTICRLGQIAGPVRSESGLWSQQEWFSSLLLSSKAMGMLPDSMGAMGRIDWIPVDVLADILTEVINDSGSEPSNDDHEVSLGQEKGQTPEACPPKSSASSDVNASGVSTPELTGYSTPASSICSATSRLADSAQLTKFLHFVNPQSASWSDLASSAAGLLGEGVQIVPYDKWVQEVASSVEDSSKDLPAAKLIDFFQDIGKEEAARSAFSVERSTQQTPRALITAGNLASTGHSGYNDRASQISFYG
ncbi:Putative AMP-dependent synthetase/ligase, fatty acyl-coenzyme A reductase, NAD-binding protein [Septoria linicola]|uniref:AMP-dependent synthetase/ligase, fatty acyl-coenzyme A reductase, NAD-binding protein n=1 Tax=Septoria linicola TaxID=215465 RepID=A0A9Q9AT54_9PEZI|nr:putative AMP-dependent synthetase/ligase, fatty acyl-coenzyme A reductase, NAD-binding protein [Septoria linicola]USW54949.1 Putative AMP-dependent synthetase/ligase, fatty acyl-coenzyme A reductase, NAD-binding protein [Septoria linicola]